MKAFAFVVSVLLLSMAGISHNIVMAKGQSTPVEVAQAGAVQSESSVATNSKPD